MPSVKRSPIGSPDDGSPTPCVRRHREKVPENRRGSNPPDNGHPKPVAQRPVIVKASQPSSNASGSRRRRKRTAEEKLARRSRKEAEAAAEHREAARTGARPTVRNALARSGSAKELLAVLASAEAYVWAGRELKRGGEAGRLSGEAHVVRAIAMFGSVVSVINKLKAFSGTGVAGAVKA